MNQAPLVGRDEALKQLLGTLIGGWNHHGSVVFIEGEAGMGKTMLLKMLRDAVTQIPELEKVIFVEGTCYKTVGSQSAYQPFMDILEALTKPRDSQRKNLATLTVHILKETAPDWLQMIPVVGAALGAGVKTASLAQEWFLETRDDASTHQSRSLGAQFVNTLSKLSLRLNLVALVIEDAHWIDDASCQLLLRLASQINQLPLVVLVTYRPDFLGASHPLQQVQRELQIKGLSQTIVLDGLTAEQIQSYILKRFSVPLHPKLVAWLQDLCKGNPLFITQYISLLEQQQVIQGTGRAYQLNGEITYAFGQWKLSGKLADLPIPDSLEMLLEQRIERLLEEDRELLQLGAVQGDTFMSLLLAELLAKQELDVLSRLRRVIERHRIISVWTGEEWLKNRSEIYIFEHHLMRQALYNKLSPRECVLYHRSIALFLERLLKEQANPPRRLLLEVAYHYDKGEALLEAAQYYYRSAQSSFLDGAFVETIELCKTARKLLKQLGREDRLLAEVLRLLFVASENRLKALSEPEEEFSPVALIHEAEEAARRTGDFSLLAQILYHKAEVVRISEGLTNCLQIFQEALNLAQQSGDRFCEVVVMEELGHNTVGTNLAEGLNILYRAYDLYQHLLVTETLVQTKTHERLLHRMQGHIGVAEFDRGNYDEAEKWLRESISGIRRLAMRDDLPRTAAFLSQLYIATGRFEEAEQILRESIDVYKDTEEFFAWRGYHLGLLGKLYIEWERIDDAADPMLKAWQNVQATRNADIAPLVRNYYAELMLHPNYHRREPAVAERVLETNFEESRASGFHRSAICALTLLSRLKLLAHNNRDAALYSTQSVDYLHRFGTMPALRTEEVFFNHYLALKAINQDDEAYDYLKQAYEIIQEKTKTLNAPERRQMFLERVPLSRMIVYSYMSITPRALPALTSTEVLSNSPEESTADPQGTSVIKQEEK